MLSNRVVFQNRMATRYRANQCARKDHEETALMIQLAEGQTISHSMSVDSFYSYLIYLYL